ncbi:MAG: hypothetical protein MUE40_04270, partial [Anaerolineae bacterium]|nr:hypothetical protein [Anaerolineae bacterium]
MKLSRRIVFSSAVQNGLLLSVLLAWTLLLLPAALTLAQETTPEAPVTVTVTEAPPAATVEAPLATVEPAATLPATDLPPAATAEATTGTDLPAATAEATAAPPFTGFSADFSAWTGAGWQVVGWQSAADADGNAFLTAALPGMVASPEGLSLADFQLEARLKADAGSTLEIVLRAGEQSDRLMFSALGAVRLYRGETLLAASAAPALSTPDWFNVTIIAAGERLGVSINAVPHLAYTGAAPLPAGPVQFVSGAENTGSVALDDVVLLPVDAATVILPTPALPTDAPATEIIVSPAAPLTPPAEATAEATAAATAEPETTPEPEATAEAEMTALPETTPAAETTPEADAAATAEADPAALSAADLARIAPQFLPIVESQLRGDAAALAAALQAGGVLVDDQGRILMQVYYAPGYDIAGAAAAVNGEVLLALATSAEMFISPASLPALLQNPD